MSICGHCNIWSILLDGPIDSGSQILNFCKRLSSSSFNSFSAVLLKEQLLEVSFQKLQKLVQQPRFFSLFFIPLFLKWKWNLRFPHLPRIKDDVANSDKVYIYDGAILRAIVNDFQPWSSFVLFHFYKNSILGFWCGSKYASELIY